MAERKTEQQKKRSTDQRLSDLKKMIEKTAANNREIQRLLQEMADDRPRPSSSDSGGQRS